MCFIGVKILCLSEILGNLLWKMLFLSCCFRVRFMFKSLSRLCFDCICKLFIVWMRFIVLWFILYVVLYDVLIRLGC